VNSRKISIVDVNLSFLEFVGWINYLLRETKVYLNHIKLINVVSFMSRSHDMNYFIFPKNHFPCKFSIVLKINRIIYIHVRPGEHTHTRFICISISKLSLLRPSHLSTVIIIVWDVINSPPPHPHSLIAFLLLLSLIHSR
jgi:hypothetical protein